MRSSRIGAVCVLLLQSYALAEATVSLKAVAKNGIPITPTNSVAVARGDIVTAEVYLYGWGNPPFDPPDNTGLVSTYQVTLAGKAGARSSGNCSGHCNNAFIAPLGWNAPLDKNPCPCEDACYPTCDSFYGCVSSTFHPEQMAGINAVRSDYIFWAFSNFPGVGTESPDIVWSGSLNNTSDGQTPSRCEGGSNTGDSCFTNSDCPNGICNTNFRSYLGTLNLKVGAAVCGTHTYTFYSDIDRTFITNPITPPVTALPKIEGLTLANVGFVCSYPFGACCADGPYGVICSDGMCPEECSGPNQRFGGAGSNCGNINPPCSGGGGLIITSNPAHCIIDARRPHPPNMPSQRQGFSSWTWTFPSPLGSGENAPNDFQVTQVPATTPPAPPTVSGVTIESANTVTIHLSAPVQPNKWTCLRHIASSRRYCVGFLPGDADSNRSASPLDILALIDNLNGIRNPPLQLHQCDIDRSGMCAPADILTEIDLLNGATGFPVQNGRSLEACPSTTP
jgi:hypothetical protein